MSAYYNELKTNKKKNETEGILYGLYLTLDEAGALPIHFCSNLTDVKQIKQICMKKKSDLIKVLVEDFVSAANGTKLNYGDYLGNNSENVKNVLKTLHLLTKAKTIFIRIQSAGVLTSFSFGDIITFTQHSCGKGCVVSELGVDEAFIAGFMVGLQKPSPRYDECLEMGSLVEISALKVEGTVN